MYQAATYTSATMNKPPITAAIPRRRTASAIFGEEDAAGDRRQADEERGGGDLADGALGVPEAVVVDLAGDVAEAVVEPVGALLAPAPATGCLEAARDQRNEAPRSIPRPPVPPWRTALCVCRTAFRKIDLKVSVSITPSERELEGGAEARRLLVPACTSCSVSRWASSFRTASEFSGLDRPGAD